MMFATFSFFNTSPVFPPINTLNLFFYLGTSTRHVPGSRCELVRVGGRVQRRSANHVRRRASGSGAGLQVVSREKKSARIDGWGRVMHSLRAFQVSLATLRLFIASTIFNFVHTAVPFSHDFILFIDSPLLTIPPCRVDEVVPRTPYVMTPEYLDWVIKTYRVSDELLPH